MAYTDVGSGEPVVLLHGIPTWSYLYVDVIPRLSPHCRVIAPDLLGHGWSDRRDRFDRSLPARQPPSWRCSTPSMSNVRPSSAMTPGAASRSSSASSTPIVSSAWS
jgi:pimeloyl-ACP methyl ester carboxylesterase